MSLVEPAGPPVATNAPAYSVTELAFALKRTLEDAYGHVRLRGEISKVTRHASGHVYLSLKDDKACIDGVIWKSVRGIAVRPEMGMEVIVTGKVTTYPARSSYQLVIETLEPAGVGALLAQLERLKEKLRGEGLFDAARKRPIPAMPSVIGVVTSPTGAVIRDILHRVRERWPCHVVVWPVVVQGEGAAAQVAAAVRGFNALAPGGPVARPDLIVVARGGGSIEDLWPFNDEALARTVAGSAIPLISAVGHETDTTLIDFVSDRRAPTPTAAAEMATPVLADLVAAVADGGRRIERCTHRALERGRDRLRAAERGLPRPEALLGFAQQRFDLAGGRLGAALAKNAAVHERELARASGRLNPALLARPRQVKADRLAAAAARLSPAAGRRMQRASERLASTAQAYRLLDPEGPLDRGFALVRRPAGALVRAAAQLSEGEPLRLRFRDGERAATVDGAARAPSPPAPSPPAPSSRRAKAAEAPAKAPPAQGSLFE